MQYRHLMPSSATGTRAHRWGVILAGGDGRRLLALTRQITGEDRPKQFSPIMGSETLLKQTQNRIAGLVKQWQTLLVLTRCHERFYADQVAGLPEGSLLVQPENRGTAPAILYSLMHIREMDPRGVVAFFPSDHHFSDDDIFADHIEAGLAAAQSHPDLVILLGITPDSPEIEYGWIEAGARVTSSRSGSSRYGAVRRITRFWEKPSQDLAAALMSSGCLWNSFVMMGHVQAFLRLVRCALPGLFQRFESVRASLFSTSEKDALRNLYVSLPSTAFAADVLSVRPSRLAVLPASGLGWSDLGRPNRVFSALRREGLEAHWAVAAADTAGAIRAAGY